MAIVDFIDKFIESYDLSKLKGKVMHVIKEAISKIKNLINHKIKIF